MLRLTSCLLQILTNQDVAGGRGLDWMVTHPLFREEKTNQKLETIVNIMEEIKATL